MAGGCRDCRRCTESPMAGCLLGPFRLLAWMLGGFLVRSVQQTCPQCRHPMSWHQRVGPDRRLAD